MATENQTPPKSREHTAIETIMGGPVDQVEDQEAALEESEEEDQEDQNQSESEGQESTSENEENDSDEDEEESESDSDENDDDSEEDEEGDEEESEDEDQEEEEEDQEGEVNIPAWEAQIREAFPDREFNSQKDWDSATSDLIQQQREQLQAENEANELLVESWNSNPRVLKINQLILQGYPEDVAVAMAGFSAEDLADIDPDDPQQREKFIEAKLNNKKAREEAKKQQDKIEKNRQKVEGEIRSYQKNHKLSDARIKDLVAKADDFFQRGLNLEIDQNMIDILYKGFFAQEIEQKAEDRGLAKGRNQKIKIDKAKRKGDGVPKLNPSKSVQNSKPVKYDDPLTEVLDQARQMR